MTALRAEGCGGGWRRSIKRGAPVGAGCVEGLCFKGRRKVLKFDRPMAGGFSGLTGPLGPRVVVAAGAAGFRRAFPTGASPVVWFYCHCCHKYHMSILSSAHSAPALAGERWCRQAPKGEPPEREKQLCLISPYTILLIRPPAVATLYPASRDLPKGKRLTRFSGRYRSPTARLSPTHDILRVTAFLQNMFAGVTRVRLPPLFRGQNRLLYAFLSYHMWHIAQRP